MIFTECKPLKCLSIINYSWLLFFFSHLTNEPLPNKGQTASGKPISAAFLFNLQLHLLPFSPLKADLALHKTIYCHCYVGCLSMWWRTDLAASPHSPSRPHLPLHLPMPFSPQLGLALLRKTTLPPKPISPSQPMPPQPSLIQGSGTILCDSWIFLSVRREIMGIHYGHSLQK